MRHLALPHLAFLICSIWLCRKLLCFKYLLATGSAAYHFRQRQSRHRRRNKRHPAAKGQALRGARLKALLALDFCLCVRGHSCNSFIQMHICGTARVFHPGEEFQRGRSCKSKVCTKWPYLRLPDNTTHGSRGVALSRQHRRRNKRHPAAKGQALRGARLKALLALDFCLGMRGHSCNSFIQMHICGTARVFYPGEEFQRGSSCKTPYSQYATTDTCRSTQGFPPDH